MNHTSVMTGEDIAQYLIPREFPVDLFFILLQYNQIFAQISIQNFLIISKIKNNTTVQIKVYLPDLKDSSSSTGNYFVPSKRTINK